MNLQEVRDTRARIWEAEAKPLNEKRRSEKREFTAEEKTQWDALNQKLDSLGEQIKTEEQAEARAREFSARVNPGVGRADTDNPPGPQGGGEVREYRHPLHRARQVRAAGFPIETPEERVLAFNGASRRGSKEYEAAFRASLLTGEQRALQADLDIIGGYTVVPERFIATLIKFVDDAVFMRQLATVLPVTDAASLGAASLDADPADADWTSELATGSEDTAMAFGKRELKPNPLAKRIKVSKKLARASALNIEALVQQRLGYKFAVSEEKSFLTGHGAAQPLGVFTASANGISAGRDKLTGSATDVTADGLIDAQGFLKQAYQARAVWLFHRDAITRIRKLKGSDLNYLWQPGLQGGNPDLILGRPYIVSEFVPNTFTTGLYVGMLADFSFYWIADALNMTVERLVELYAETNQVGFIGRLETDGMPVLEEAFVRLKTN